MIYYHYCSNFAFHSIINEKRIRLSLLSLSNDTKEGLHVLDAAIDIIPNDTPRKAEIIEQLKTIIPSISAIGFCLSTDGDLLSQWRGYADNAQGVSIGFDSDELKAITKQESNKSLKFGFVPVLYDEKTLATIVMAYLQKVFDHYSSGKMNPPRVGSLLGPMTNEEKECEGQRYHEALSELFHLIIPIANYNYLVKSPFFKEEKEHRIIAQIVNSETLEIANPKFQPCSEMLKPYIDFPQNGFSPTLMKEVILGPRNKTPIKVMKLFLVSQGFEHVSIRISNGSYQ